MDWWLRWLIAIVLALVIGAVVLAVWLARGEKSLAETPAEVRAMGRDLVRLPGRLRSLSRDPEVPRSVRWMAIGLAVYLLSPIDLIPDFLPVIGALDDVVIAPLVLWAIRRRIPNHVWRRHFPARSTQSAETLSA